MDATRRAKCARCYEIKPNFVTFHKYDDMTICNICIQEIFDKHEIDMMKEKEAYRLL